MESNNQFSNGEKDKRSKVLLYSIIALLVALNIGFFYMWQKGNKEKELVQGQLVTANEDNKEKDKLLQEAEFLIKKYQADSAAMAKQGKEMTEEIKAKKEELSRLYAQMKNKDRVSSAEIAKLKLEIANLTEQIAKLEKENTELKEINAKLDEEKKEAEAKNEELTSNNKTLSAERDKYKSVAERLQTSELKVEALKKRWLTGKETTTDKASNVESFRTTVKIAENPEAPEGERVIYVKITGPQGTTLGTGSEAGTFPYQGAESKYTYKINTNYTGEELSLPPSKWTPKGDLKAGVYTFELYCEGYLMGAKKLTLK